MKSSLLVLVIMSAAMLAACTGKPLATSSPAVATIPTTRAAESLPPGDIPDTQTFVAYVSPQGGYRVDAPEGWSRSLSGLDVRFENGYDGESIAMTRASTAPTLLSGTLGLMSWIHRTTQNVHNVRTSAMNTPSGPMPVLQYRADSAPNAVTGKRVPLDYQTRAFYKDGHVAILTLWAPAGSDNVDQWKRIAQSFRWR